MSNMTRLGYRWQRSLTTSALGWMLIVGGAVVGAGLATPAVAQEPVLRVLTVTGRGREAVPTTLTQATLGVEVQGSSAEAVQTAVAERSDRLVQYLRSRNVDELETVGLRLNPQYDYRNGQARIIGYVGTNTVSCQIAHGRGGGTAGWCDRSRSHPNSRNPLHRRG
jgi:uncharacterized protein YggE